MYRSLPWIVTFVTWIITWLHNINKTVRYSTELGNILTTKSSRRLSTYKMSHKFNTYQYKIIRNYVNYSSINDFVVLLIILIVISIIFSFYDVKKKSLSQKRPLQYFSNKILYVLNFYLKRYVLDYIFDIVPIIIAVMAAIEAIHPTSFNTEPFFQRCLRLVVPSLSSLKFIQICYTQRILNKFDIITKAFLKTHLFQKLLYYIKSIGQFFLHINYSYSLNEISLNSCNQFSLLDLVYLPEVIFILLMLVNYSLPLNYGIPAKSIMFMAIDPLIFSILGYLYSYNIKYYGMFYSLVEFVVNILISSFIFLIIYSFLFNTKINYNNFTLVYALIAFLILSVLFNYKKNKYNLCFQYANGAIICWFLMIINEGNGYMMFSSFDNINVITVIMGYGIFFLLGEIININHFNKISQYCFSFGWAILVILYVKLKLFEYINVISYSDILPLIISIFVLLTFVFIECNENYRLQ